MTIATVLNDAFAEYFRVLLYSIRRHHPGFNLPVRVIHSRTLSPLSEENREKLRTMHPRMEFVLAEDSPYERFFPVTPPHLHPALLKLEAFNLRDCDRVLFLDSDTLCLGDLSELFGLDVPFAACPAGKSREMKERRANTFRRFVGFNSGVMVIGRQHLTGRTYERLLLRSSPLKPCPTADQDILNRFFRWRKIYCLDHRYNYNSAFFWKGDETDVRIVHYTGPKPLVSPREPRMEVWFRYYEEMKREF